MKLNKTNILHWLKKAVNLITYPIVNDNGLFVFSFLVLTLVEAYARIERGQYQYVLYIICWNILSAYTICVVHSLCINKIVKRIWSVFVYAALFIFSSVDCFFWLYLKGGNYWDMPEIIKNTNLNETREFLIHVLTPGIILIVALYLSVYLGLIYISRHIKKPNIKNWQSGCICGMLLVSLLACMRNPAAREDSFAGKLYLWITVFTRKAPDFHDYFKHPELKLSESSPRRLVIIIGESFSKYHSSLYGYDKNTNPRLGALPDSNLYIFRNVESPAYSTKPSFREFMNDHQLSKGDSRPWYECLTIHEVFATAGYHTTWLSNQTKYGFLDNEITAYANLSDDCVFMNDRSLAIGQNEPDGVLIPALDSIRSTWQDDKKELLWIHLMGSHTIFSHRYPAHATKYTEKDYPDKPENQRKLLSEYDNSIQYNDSVVAEIISRFRDTDACIVYFSDHGFDVYYSDPQYCYYGRANVEQSAKTSRAIPFIAYLSDTYLRRNPDASKKLSEAIDRPFNTEVLIYFLMDLCGIEIVGNNDVENKSPLSYHYED